MKRVLTAVLAVVTVAGSEGAQTHRFVLDTLHALAGSTGKGVAVFPDGSLRPLPPLTAVATFDEPLGLALAVAPDGTAFVGTGHPARVYRVKQGAKELVGEAKADQVTALLLDPDGNLWVSTAAPALLLRCSRGKGALEEVARLQEGSLWDLAWFKGGLVVAAGSPGRLLRLTAKGLEAAATIPDRHARCLAVNRDVLLVGTSGKGLVMRWTGSSPPGVVYDSSFTEIAALAPAPDGSTYAAGITGDPTLGKPPAKDDGDATVTISVSESASTTPQTAKGPATSEIVRILPAGAATTAYRFTKQIASTLTWGEEGLVIGTGLDGELWQLVEGSAAMLDTVNAAQVSRVAAGGSWVLTQSPTRLLHRSGKPRGTFASPPLDAGQPAQWGDAALAGELPAREGCTLRFRSGAIGTPDDTWSAWSAPVPCPGGRVTAPPARFLQWEVSLDPAEGTPVPRVGRTEVTYRQINLPPEIKEFEVHDPGEVFLKGPPPSDRIVEVQHPDLSGIFTTLDDEPRETQDRVGKRYYRIGYQSLSWKAEDPNGDPLRFTVEIQNANGGAWWRVRGDLEATSIAVDTQALPDGLYRFRLTATDAPANPEEPATVQALSSVVVVDNTPPTVAIARTGSEWLVTVDDALSPVTRVEWNRDADAWHAISPEDGLLDRRHETFRIPVQGGVHVLAVRAVDDHHNRATAAVEEKP